LCLPYPGRIRAAGFFRRPCERAASLFALRTALAVRLFLLPAAGAHADEQSVETTAPEVVAVGRSAGKGFESAADSAGFVEVIDAADSWRGYRTVGDLLRHGVGVRVRSFGAREDFATLSVRGSTASQVKILVDGVSYNRADDSVVNLADLPIDAVERIEIYRGFTPVRFASSGASSVVNIITRRPTTDRRGAALSIGSFTTGKISLDVAKPGERGITSAFMTYRRTNGDFEFKDDNNTPQNPFDDRRVKRENNDLQSWDLLLRSELDDVAGGRLTLSGSTYYKDEGAPGFDTPQSLLSRFRQWRSIFSSRWKHDAGFHVGADVTILEESVRDPLAIESGVDTSLGFPYEAADSTTVAPTLEAGFSRAFGPLHFLEASLEGAYETIDERFELSTENRSQRQSRYRLAVALGDEIYVAAWRHSIAPQLRYESIWNDFDFGDLAGPAPVAGKLPGERDDSIDPRLGLRWDTTESLALKANVSTYFRPPAFGELFGDAGFSAANPTLDAEQGVSADIGLIWRLPSGTNAGPLTDAAFEYAYFRNEVDDMIVFVPSGNRVPRPQNIGRARVTGHELRLEARTSAGLSLEANATFQNPENRTKMPESFGKQLPSIPEDEAYLRLGLARGRWEIAYQLDYRSQVFLDAANTSTAEFRVPSFATHGATLAWKPVDADFRIELQAINLSDEQKRDVVGYPVPGRAFYLTFSVATASAPERVR
jgi:iron complex outermembrane receptor protein